MQKLGDTTATAGRSIFLTGDGHVLNLKDFFDELGEMNNFSFQTLTCDSYVPIEGIKRYS